MSTYPMIEKLCSLGSSALADEVDLQAAEQYIPSAKQNADQLIWMLRVKNGFYAFESALHVFPLVTDDRLHSQDLWRWNSMHTWKYAYGNKARNIFCFAEDV